VRLGFVAAQREPTVGQARVTAVDEADPVLREERLLVEARLQPRHQADGQVGVGGLQGTRGVRVDARGFQPHARRHGAHVR
jgi:hypothetical protein